MLVCAAFGDVFMQDFDNLASLRACRLLAALAERAHLAGLARIECLRGDDARDPLDHVGHVVRLAARAQARLLGIEA